jgi:hypothetical protein
VIAADDGRDHEHRQRCDERRGNRRLNDAAAARIVSAGLHNDADLDQPRLVRWLIGVTRPLTPGHAAQYRAAAKAAEQGFTTVITVCPRLLGDGIVAALMSGTRDGG